MRRQQASRLALRLVLGSSSKIEMKEPKGYYVYSIRVDGIVRYIGKGKGLRMYSHMKEVRDRLNRDFKLKNMMDEFCCDAQRHSYNDVAWCDRSE